MTSPSYAETIQNCLRELARSHPELLHLRGGDVEAGERWIRGAEQGRERCFAAVGVAGVRGPAAGLALAGRRTLVTLSPSGSALAALQRLRVDLAAPTGSDARSRRPLAGLPLVVRVRVEGSEPTLGHFSSLRGFRVAAPAAAGDAAGLLRHAVADDAPWIWVEDRRLLARAADTGAGGGQAGSAVIRRPGRDITVVAFSVMSLAALRAADVLADRGIEAEVLDPRTIAPFDMETVVRSIWRTHRVLVVDEGETLMGPAIAAGIGAAAFDDLDAPVEVVRVDPRPSLPEALAGAAAAIATHACWMMGRPVQTA